MASPRKNAESDKPRRPPATTPEAREKQIIALAYDEVEKQIRAGTATSQILTHWLKLGSPREKQEREKLSKEIELLTQRAEQIKSAENMEVMYKAAMDAMVGYQGREVEPEYED